MNDADRLHHHDERDARRPAAAAQNTAGNAAPTLPPA